jgi:hypothetical protein
MGKPVGEGELKEWMKVEWIWFKYFLDMYENKIMNLIKIVWKWKGEKIQQNNRVSIFDQSTLYASMELSQWDPFV